MKKMKMKLKDKVYEIALYENNVSDTLYDSLPQEVHMSKWGGEFYGSLKAPLSKVKTDTKYKEYYEEGEVALWPDGNAFCIFFGETPASNDHRPRMASLGVPLGKISLEDFDSFYELGNRVKIVLEK